MFHQFSIGLSNLRAAQVGLNVVGHNLANANTPGYHRQVVRFVEAPSYNLYGLELGTGVLVGDITRVQSHTIDAAARRNLGDTQNLAAHLDVARQLESMLGIREGSIVDQMDRLFTRLEELSARPDDPIARSDVTRTARALTDAIGRAAEDITRMQADLVVDLESQVSEVNRLANEIRGLNIEIRNATANGETPNALLDQRASLIGELAAFGEVVVSQSENSVTFGNGALLIGESAPAVLKLGQDENGIFVTAEGRDRPVSFHSGSIGGIVQAIEEVLPQYSQRLDELARGLIETFDEQHVQGVGLDGAFSSLNGQRFVSDVTAPLSSLSGILPVRAGTLTVSILDATTGDRTLHTIDMDPAVDSVQSFAAKIQAIPGLNAAVDSVQGALSIVAQPGIQFDFTGLPATFPDTSGLSGTSNPQMGGIYHGDTNDDLEFVFTGTGQVGVTDQLRLEVRASSGAILETVNIGEGYSPGDEITLNNGLTIQLNSGTVNQDESFGVQAVANSDESGILTALGLNTFFSGTDAGTIALHPGLAESHQGLATSVTGDPGDGVNLTAMIQRQNHAVAGLNGLSVKQSLDFLVSQIGSEVRSLDSATSNLDAIGQNLEAQIASLSGVDTDEELTRMLQYQRYYEAGARFIAAVDETLQELLNIL